MNICVLSLEEAGRYEFYGIFPPCKAHRHISRTEAETLLLADTHRTVGSGKSLLSAIAPCVTNDNYWQPRPSGHPMGPKVWQYVHPRR